MQHAEAHAWTEIAKGTLGTRKRLYMMAEGMENHEGASAAKPVAEPVEAAEKGLCFIKNVKIHKKHILTPQCFLSLD